MTTIPDRGKRSQPFAPTGGQVDGQQVLDPDAHLAVQVDPRLDAEHGRAGQRQVAWWSAQTWGELVVASPDPVGRCPRWAEPVTVTGRDDDLPSEGVDRPPARQWWAAANRVGDALDGAAWAAATSS